MSRPASAPVPPAARRSGVPAIGVRVPTRVGSVAAGVRTIRPGDPVPDGDRDRSVVVRADDPLEAAAEAELLAARGFTRVAWLEPSP